MLVERLAMIHAKVMVVHPLYVKQKMVVGMLLVLVSIYIYFYKNLTNPFLPKHFAVNQGVSGECATETPGIYTDIYHFKDFIEDVDTSIYPDIESEDNDYIDIRN